MNNTTSTTTTTTSTTTTDTAITLNIPVSLLPSVEEVAKKFISAETFYACENDLKGWKTHTNEDMERAIEWVKETYFPTCVPTEHPAQVIVQGAREDGKDISFNTWFVEVLSEELAERDNFTNSLTAVEVNGEYITTITIPRLVIQFQLHENDAEDQFAVIPFYRFYWEDGSHTGSTLVIGRDNNTHGAFTVWFENLHDQNGQPEDSNDSDEGHIIRGIKLEDLDTAIEDVFVKLSAS